jgi:hypothetical protein|tara:strand:- start:703 stop:981 length:279 start_codon:yes stop_codon:yes gene_type:complete
MANDSARREPKLLSQELESFVTAFSPMALQAGQCALERASLSAALTVAVPFIELGFNRNFSVAIFIESQIPTERKVMSRIIILHRQNSRISQ